MKKCEHNWERLYSPNSLFQIITNRYWCCECGTLKEITIFLGDKRKPKIKYTYPKNREEK